MKILKNFLIDQNQALSEALKYINNNKSGILFTLDQGVLVGSLSDGDLRRAFINGATLKDECKKYHNKNVISLPVGSSNSEIQSCLSADAKLIPLVDAKGFVLDLASLYQLHNFVVMQPYLHGNELEYLTDCINSGWISSQGKYVTKFEQEISILAGGGRCVATSNGTSALHLALEALGITAGDEVIVPSFTFGASVNAIVHAGATPVIVDIDPKTWNINPNAISKAITKKTKAILVVHIYGNPCNMKEILKIASLSNLLVVEDCAEAIGATIDKKPVGSFGHAAAFSFFANKILTCGEGGALILNDAKLINRALELRDHGMDKNKRYWHNLVGFNYRMTNMQAAVGLAQTEQFSMFVQKRNIIWAQYRTRLEKSGYFDFQSNLTGHITSKWLFTVLIAEPLNISIENLLMSLENKGIECRPVFYPMSEMPSFRNIAKIAPDPITQNISKRGLSLPSSISLTESEIDYISSTLLKIIEEYALNSSNDSK